MKQLYDLGVSQWGETPMLFTDKDTWHSYLHVYEKVFNSRTDVNLLEIGICAGGSVWLWQQYFKKYKKNYNITAIDINDTFVVNNPGFQESILNDENIRLIWNTDCTKESSYSSFEKFDVIIDDGPHTLSSQIDALSFALPKLEKNGVYLIEDISKETYINLLEQHALSICKDINMERYIGLKNNREDDMMLIIRKV